MSPSRERFREITGPGRVILLLLLAAAIGVGLVFALARDSDDTSDSRSGAQAPATTTTPERERPTTPQRRLKTCRATPIPRNPRRPVSCRTRTAILTFAGEGRPLLLGGTHLRVLAASIAGGTGTTRLRLRNETDAEQGVHAGGQEIYLNIDGLRVDADVTEDVRVAPNEGVTIVLEYRLSPRALRALGRTRLRADLGVKPWDEPSRTERHIGVIRLRIRSVSA